MKSSIVALLALVAVARGDVRPAAVRQANDAPLVTKTREALRPERLAGRALDDVAQDLAGYGTPAIQCFFAFLVGGVSGPLEEGASMPADGALDPDFVLLAALARMDATLVAAHVAAAATGPASLDVRLVAMRVLSLTKGPAAIDAWIDVLGEVPDIHFQRAYVRAPCTGALSLVLQRDPSVFAHLADRVQKKVDPKLLPWIFQATAESRRAEGVHFLTSVLGRDDEQDLALLPRIAELVELTSGDMAESDATWVRALATHDRADIARQAILALGRVQDWRAHAILFEALGSPDPFVAEAAHWSLARMSAQDFGLDRDAWGAWFESETRWNETEAPAVLERLADPDPARVIDGLRALPEHLLFRHDLAREVVRLLHGENRDLARAACAVLGNLASPSAAPALLQVLESEDDALRAAARAALHWITGLDLASEPGLWRQALGV